MYNMFESMQFLPAFCVTMVCLMLLYWYQRPKGLPPGPRGIPLLGVIPFLGQNPKKVFRTWSQRYGPTFTARMGREDWVILNDFESINQALVRNGHAFSGRPGSPVLKIATQFLGLANVDYGKLWKEQRKFGLVTLRGFGLGKRGMEDRIIEESGYLTDEIRRQQGKPFSIRTLIAHTVSNVICGVALGRRFDYGDQWLVSLLKLLDKWWGDTRQAMVFLALQFVPWLEHFPPFSSTIKELIFDMNMFLGRLEVLVNEHEDSLDAENVRDFIDAFLVEMKKGTDTFTKMQLLYYLSDLFQAGTETTSSTLRWSLLCLIHYPQMQERIFREIVDVMGDEGRPTFSMKEQMPYCSAFIHEIGRCRTLIPLSIPHCTTEDVKLNNFVINKGTTVIANLWAVHNDPNMFDQPDKFDPGRHIDEKGNFVKSKHVIPFSVGPRFCIGEQLAKMELFLFLTSMVQKFKFEPKPGEMPDMENASKGMLFTPLEFDLIATERI